MWSTPLLGVLLVAFLLPSWSSRRRSLRSSGGSAGGTGDRDGRHVHFLHELREVSSVFMQKPLKYLRKDAVDDEGDDYYSGAGADESYYYYYYGDDGKGNAKSKSAAPPENDDSEEYRERRLGVAKSRPAAPRGGVAGSSTNRAAQQLKNQRNQAARSRATNTRNNRNAAKNSNLKRKRGVATQRAKQGPVRVGKVSRPPIARNAQRKADKTAGSRTSTHRTVGSTGRAPVARNSGGGRAGIVKRPVPHNQKPILGGVRGPTSLSKKNRARGGGLGSSTGLVRGRRGPTRRPSKRKWSAIGNAASRRPSTRSPSWRSKRPSIPSVNSSSTPSSSLRGKSPTMLVRQPSGKVVRVQRAPSGKLVPVRRSSTNTTSSSSSSSNRNRTSTSNSNSTSKGSPAPTRLRRGTPRPTKSSLPTRRPSPRPTRPTPRPTIRPTPKPSFSRYGRTFRPTPRPTTRPTVGRENGRRDEYSTDTTGKWGNNFVGSPGNPAPLDLPPAGSLSPPRSAMQSRILPNWPFFMTPGPTTLNYKVLVSKFGMTHDEVAALHKFLCDTYTCTGFIRMRMDTQQVALRLLDGRRNFSDTLDNQRLANGQWIDGLAGAFETDSMSFNLLVNRALRSVLLQGLLPTKDRAFLHEAGWRLAGVESGLISGVAFQDERTGCGALLSPGTAAARQLPIQGAACRRLMEVEEEEGEEEGEGWGGTVVSNSEDESSRSTVLGRQQPQPQSRSRSRPRSRRLQSHRTPSGNLWVTRKAPTRMWAPPPSTQGMPPSGANNPRPLQPQRKTTFPTRHARPTAAPSNPTPAPTPEPTETMAEEFKQFLEWQRENRKTPLPTPAPSGPTNYPTPRGGKSNPPSSRPTMTPSYVSQNPKIVQFAGIQLYLDSQYSSDVVGVATEGRVYVQARVQRLMSVALQNTNIFQAALRAAASESVDPALKELFANVLVVRAVAAAPRPFFNTIRGLRAAYAPSPRPSWTPPSKQGPSWRPSVTTWDLIYLPPTAAPTRQPSPRPGEPTAAPSPRPTNPTPRPSPPPTARPTQSPTSAAPTPLPTRRTFAPWQPPSPPTLTPTFWSQLVTPVPTASVGANAANAGDSSGRGLTPGALSAVIVFSILLPIVATAVYFFWFSEWAKDRAAAREKTKASKDFMLKRIREEERALRLANQGDGGGSGGGGAGMLALFGPPSYPVLDPDPGEQSRPSIDDMRVSLHQFYSGRATAARDVAGQGGGGGGGGGGVNAAGPRTHKQSTCLSKAELAAASGAFSHVSSSLPSSAVVTARRASQQPYALHSQPQALKGAGAGAGAGAGDRRYTFDPSAAVPAVVPLAMGGGATGAKLAPVLSGGVGGRVGVGYRHEAQNHDDENKWEY